MKPSYTFGDVIDALAVWEELMAIRANERRSPYTDALNDVWDAVGTAEMRSIAVFIADRISGAWNALADTPADPCDAMSYDWEFVPIMLSFIDWEAINLFREGYNLPDVGTLKARFLLRFDRSTLAA